jgi:kinesin family member 20
MIININPYDTGFDENSHVMKFAAIAREVSTNTAATGPGLNSSKPPSFLPPSNAASRAPSRLKDARTGPSYNLGVSTNHTFARKVVLSLDGSINDGRREFSNGPRTSVNTVVDIIEGGLLD